MNREQRKWLIITILSATSSLTAIVTEHRWESMLLFLFATLTGWLFVESE